MRRADRVRLGGLAICEAVSTWGPPAAATYHPVGSSGCAALPSARFFVSFSGCCKAAHSPLRAASRTVPSTLPQLRQAARHSIPGALGRLGQLSIVRLLHLFPQINQDGLHRLLPRPVPQRVEVAGVHLRPAACAYSFCNNRKYKINQEGCCRAYQEEASLLSVKSNASEHIQTRQ